MKEQALNSGPLAEQETSLTTRPWLCGYIIFFVVLACHLLVLDGFDQLLNFLHFQLSLIVPLLINLSNIKMFCKKIGNADNQIWNGWVGSENVLCRSPGDRFLTRSSVPFLLFDAFALFES